MSSRLQYGRWASVPGNFDVCRSLQVFPSSNVLGIPDLEPFNGKVPDFLLPWTQRVRSAGKASRSARHFFLDDYRFESLWTAPGRYKLRVHDCGFVLTPDFSLWLDQPAATQIWNTFRNRWMGCLWQREGVTVIPTVTWADETSYMFCFLGLPRNSVVAVSTVGCIRCPKARIAFIKGYTEMVRVLRPTLVLVYGKPISEVMALAPCHFYKTRWETALTI